MATVCSKSLLTRSPPLKALLFFPFSPCKIQGAAFNVMVRMTHFCPATHLNAQALAALWLQSLMSENIAATLIFLLRECKNESWGCFFPREG